MAGSTFGNLFCVTTWGESHGKGLGVVVDGCPAGLPLSEDDIQPFLDRRKPGRSAYATPRSEDDRIAILSGIFEGKTTGTPISMLVMNQNQQSGDYEEMASYYRPGHADYTFEAKYGFRDYLGGGRASGRETLARVAAGAIASKLLKEMGITFTVYTKSIGEMNIDYANFDKEEILKNDLCMPDAVAAKKAGSFLEEIMKQYDSVGGIIEGIVEGLPAGLGEPVFEKLDANLAKAVMSIGAVKGVEIGDGFQSAFAFGSQNNDGFTWKNDSVRKASNHAGGILGGISDGSQIMLRAALKPTPSIAKEQQTVNKNNEEITISIQGRHDPIIVPRAVVVVEAMMTLTILDALLMNMSSTLTGIKNFYHK